ncbi:hypothetical protein GN244_ATG13213 [Phytophthora infestans]|uniref:Uncharacterized protein n=1 Tax=Phytophthora infestans TaxID=4787 RepID=A0A833VYZ4_PHYIN|nr:hypothetical protein GN244_ATG13213 [Phytophthora infestans]
MYRFRTPPVPYTVGCSINVPFSFSNLPAQKHFLSRSCPTFSRISDETPPRNNGKEWAIASNEGDAQTGERPPNMSCLSLGPLQSATPKREVEQSLQYTEEVPMPATLTRVLLAAVDNDSLTASGKTLAVDSAAESENSDVEGTNLNTEDGFSKTSAPVLTNGAPTIITPVADTATSDSDPPKSKPIKLLLFPAVGGTVGSRVTTQRAAREDHE